ncbi:hypothetical protein MA16_Dca016243 [Dendrobium catenatum]|uniref:Uncharacterized protein n=1 Tax=Dendrobium catenatum TaxID=906689 RepID=A0A2I0VVU1_9ASPA|nr:hypothetical protein MA16_Dca016243 [Dendrobium catenatum]
MDGQGMAYRAMSLQDSSDLDGTMGILGGSEEALSPKEATAGSGSLLQAKDSIEAADAGFERGFITELGETKRVDLVEGFESNSMEKIELSRFVLNPMFEPVVFNLNLEEWGELRIWAS